jgi:hypothetical protein
LLCTGISGKRRRADGGKSIKETGPVIRRTQAAGYSPHLSGRETSIPLFMMPVAEISGDQAVLFGRAQGESIIIPAGSDRTINKRREAHAGP